MESRTGCEHRGRGWIGKKKRNKRESKREGGAVKRDRRTDGGGFKAEPVEAFQLGGVGCHSLCLPGYEEGVPHRRARRDRRALTAVEALVS